MGRYFKNFGFVLVLVSFVGLYLVLRQELSRLENPRETRFQGQSISDLVLVNAKQDKIDLGAVVKKNSDEGFQTLLCLWATWCEPCVRELKGLEQFQRQLEEAGWRVVLINYDSGKPERVVPEVLAWKISHNIKLESFFDFEESVLKKYSVGALPASIAIDKRNRIAWTQYGEIDWLELSKTQIE